MRILLLLTVCALCAFEPAIALDESASKPEALQKELDDTNEELIAIVRQPLSDFIKESPPACDSRNLGKTSGNALHLSKLVERGAIDLSAKHRLDLGSTIVDIADAALKAGCKEEARALYDYVIAVFVGGNFASIRQRAQIGIEDLRRR